MTAHTTNLKVRQACVADADACSAVLCASIRELCTADHRGDENIIARWLVNKTPESLREWLPNPEVDFYVAEIDSRIAGVGAISDSVEIALNYVSPEYRFLGVSRAVLAKLETTLCDRGVRSARLTSTRTARDFYRKNGWLEVGEPQQWLGMPCFPMRKEFE